MSSTMILELLAVLRVQVLQRTTSQPNEYLFTKDLLYFQKRRYLFDTFKKNLIQLLKL